MKSAKYYRQSKTWQKWIGKTGKVLSSTIIRTSSSEFEPLVPYSFLIIDFKGVKKEMMGAGQDVFSSGDKVQCVLRKIDLIDSVGVIEYGVKAKKIGNK